MRYIDTSHIIVPSNWVDLAKKEKNEPLWSYFKEEFEKIAGKKCWYSESSNSGSINPIDHFRPQANDIKQLPKEYKKLLGDIIWNQLEHSDRMGYYFLVYDFSNYRYTCDIVNSQNKKITKDKITRGKSNIFPLKKGSLYGTCEATIQNEEIALLDPCVKNDVEMLTFTENGLIESHIGISNNSWEDCRVKVSIEVYHLNYSIFIEDIKEIWKFCEERIKLLDLFYIKARRKETITTLERKSFQTFQKEILDKIKITAQFSAVAIDCIQYYENRYSWIKQVFQNLRK